MGGPSTHGQKNKPHKAGRQAGKGARARHRDQKAGGHLSTSRRAKEQSKEQRLASAKATRDAKRRDLLDKRRSGGAPRVVGLLPLSEAVDVQAVWSELLTGCAELALPTSTDAGGKGTGKKKAGVQGMDVECSGAGEHPLAMCTVSLGRSVRQRLTLLPLPAASRSDPLALVDLARAAEVLLLVVPADASQEGVDQQGASALAVLRAMGLPYCVGVVHTAAASAAANGSDGNGACKMSDDAPGGAGGGANGRGGGGGLTLKERAAAKKRAVGSLAPHVSGDTRVFPIDTAQDVAQLLRHVAEHPLQLPGWRQQRPSLMVQGAEFKRGETGGQQEGEQGCGTLYLRGYVRSLGLSANQLLHLPGAGDFQMERIEGPPEPPAIGEQPHQPHHQQQRRCAGGAEAMDVASTNDGGALSGVAGGATGGVGGAVVVLAEPDPEAQEPLVHENEPDPLAGEQTWPTEEELADAAAARAGAKPRAKRRLPQGTSAYQAAWILDEDASGDEDDDDEEVDDEGLPDAVPLAADETASADPSEWRAAAVGTGMGMGMTSLVQGGARSVRFEDDDGDDDDNDDGMAVDEEEEGAGGQGVSWAQLRRRRAEQDEADEALFPDEVDTPGDVAARVRFAKYRGLKSWRSSSWDPREALPLDYGRVFAFDNFKRTQKRAREAAAATGGYNDMWGVEQGSYVCAVVRAVPEAAAANLLARVDAVAKGNAVPLVATGLLQHEAKLSVLHFAVSKAAGYSPPLANKEELLLVTGIRSFPARPVYSSDDFGCDKHKMERFLHEGRPAIATVYCPITYPPCPVLGFKCEAGRAPQLAFTGSLRGCDPDRIVLKKVVLTGWPVRVHKHKAVVRFMFHNPDDIRWFRTLELWTKYGRRGRIKEPLGTHGTMKCMFDGPIQQRDSICVSLYKRVYPKWPRDLTFA